MQKNTIKFISHASMLINVGDCFILTDPWYLTNAFGGWVQSHPAIVEDIDFILNIPKDKLFVLVSHGHDDHCDDNFVKHNLSYATPIIAKFPSPGFEARIRRMFDTEPIIVEEGLTLSHNGFKVNTYINKDFTHYDALYTISNDDIFVVHANDNWHEQPDAIISHMVKNSIGKDIYYFSQLGIADAYPMMFNRSKKDKEQAIQNRCNGYIDAFAKNIIKLNPTVAAGYANQSNMVNLQSDIKSPYETMQQTLKNTGITQMKPGMSLLGTNIDINDGGDDIFNF